MKSADISQHDWLLGQIICCPRTPSTSAPPDTILPDSQLLDAVLIDFAYASQTEVGVHLESEDFVLLENIMFDDELGLHRDVLEETWEPESELLDCGSYPL